jgi:predicted  nucleic acid-binding Zn-ribbon protein
MGARGPRETLDCRGEVELLEEIRRLMELQTLDRTIRELEESLSTIAGRVNQLQEESQRYSKELELLTAQEQEFSAARKKLERELAEGEARLRNKRIRQNLIRNEKELQALNHEVDALKEEHQRLEAEMLALTEAAAPRAARLAELQELLSNAQSERIRGEKEIAGEVEELKSRLARHRREREKLAREVNPPLLQRYEMIFSRRQGVAVAVAKAGTCQGCMRLLPPQLFNEIQKHLQIHFCPNCQRILYFEG